MTPQPNVLIIPLKVFVLNKNGESLKGLTVGTAEGTRTPNIQNRNLTLYPIELRTHLLTALRYYIRILPICKEDFPLFYFSKKSSIYCAQIFAFYFV